MDEPFNSVSLGSIVSTLDNKKFILDEIDSNEPNTRWCFVLVLPVAASLRGLHLHRRCLHQSIRLHHLRYIIFCAAGAARARRLTLAPKLPLITMVKKYERKGNCACDILQVGSTSKDQSPKPPKPKRK
jgi:hypothetical protein